VFGDAFILETMHFFGDARVRMFIYPLIKLTSVHAEVFMVIGPQRCATVLIGEFLIFAINRQNRLYARGNFELAGVTI
jgi:hypothetical protein